MNDVSSAAMPDNIEGRIAKSAAWMVMSRFAVRGIGLVSTVILARLLRPEDFGLVALAAALVGSLDALSQCGFDMALFQTNPASRAHYDTVWTLTVGRNAAIALLLAAFAGPAAIFFGDARLVEIMYFFAGGILVEGLFNVGIIDFRKELNFQREFAFQTAVKLVAFVVTVTCAFLWRNYWALIIGGLSGKSTGLMLSYLMHPYRPRFSLREWRNLIGFSKWMLLTNVGYFVSGRIATFTIGRVVDARALGFYEISNEISDLPTGEIVWPIQRALYPGYAKFADDPRRLAENYIGGMAVIVMIAIPAAFGIVVIAPLIIDVFLGAKWREALPLLQLLAIAGVMRVGYANVGPVLLALGKVRLLAWLSAITVAILAGFIIPGTIMAGSLGAAYGTVCASFFTMSIHIAATLRLTGLSVGALFRAVWRPLTAGLVMALAVSVTRPYWSALGFVAIVELAAVVVMGAIVYVAATLGLWRLAGAPPGAERDILRLVLPLLRRWRLAVGRRRP